MLTRLKVHRFKNLEFEDDGIELGQSVVLMGPNNSGKTSALQSLALWSLGVRRWVEKRQGKKTPEKRPGVTVNRQDCLALPIPNARLLWQDLHVRDVTTLDGRQQTKNIRIDIMVEGVTRGKAWECGLEFDYANEESFYCRPLRLSEGSNSERLPVPPEATMVEVAFLSPMSGLAANETRLDPGAINVRLGEGRTAEVLRNLCYGIAVRENPDQWDALRRHMEELFGVSIQRPEYIEARGEIMMSYQEKSGLRLDLSCSGRGFQQTLLILAHLYANPGTVLLMDEPDAHLEILRQRQVYQLLTDITNEQDCQLIAASHSEVILNEAAGRDIVIAFLGKPHRIDDRGSQVLKSLKNIGFEDYYQAEQTGWVLYLEGSSDLAILRAFAEALGHGAQEVLKRPFVHYVLNQPSKARDHFFGLKEARPGLKGVALYDRLDQPLAESRGEPKEMTWARREIENYLCCPEVLLAYARAEAEDETSGPLFAPNEKRKRTAAMQECIDEIAPPIALKNRDDEWWRNVKASDEFLDRVFQLYFEKLALPNLLRKSDYHQLARFVSSALLDAEVTEKLDGILEVARTAQPR